MKPPFPNTANRTDTVSIGAETADKNIIFGLVIVTSAVDLPKLPAVGALERMSNSGDRKPHVGDVATAGVTGDEVVGGAVDFSESGDDGLGVIGDHVKDVPRKVYLVRN